METASSQSSAAADATTPAPAPMPASSAPPPFLVKTYVMVDDPSTDKIVSWSPTNNSFVVWDSAEFAKELLPKYFKHSNFSSFVRQLNTYGFRKVDPDRWEFANEGFLRGQKHLLKSITRRKPSHGHPPQQQQQPTPQASTVTACVEVGKFGIEEEVEQLKRDKNVLMQELVRLRQQQQTTDVQLQATVHRLQGMEQRQQQMMSFLAKAVNSPGFLSQFMQQQPNDSSSRLITQANKKRRLKGDGDDFSTTPTDGQIVKYEPLMNEEAKPVMEQLADLQGVPPPTSVPVFVPTSSEPLPPPLGGSAPVALQAAGGPTVPGLSGMVRETGIDLFGPGMENDAFATVAGEIRAGIADELSSDALEWNEGMLDAIPDLSDPFWAEFGSPLLPTETDTRLAEDVLGGGGEVELPVENGWDKTNDMKELTEQMGLLSSESKKS